MDYVQVLVELDHNEYSNYLTLPARTYFLIVREQPSDQVLLYRVRATFLSGVTYTVILSGSIDGMTPVDFNMKVHQDLR